MTRPTLLLIDDEERILRSLRVLFFTSDTARLIELINQAQITRFLPKPVSRGMLARNLESMLERFHLVRNQPALQKRQSVAPISNPREREQAGKFMGMLGRLRARLSG